MKVTTTKTAKRRTVRPRGTQRIRGRTRSIPRPEYPKIITSADLRRHLAKTLDSVVGSKQPVIVRRHRDTSVALIDADYLEDILLLTNEHIAKSIEEAREDIAAGRTYTLEEVGKRLGLE